MPLLSISELEREALKRPRDWLEMVIERGSVCGEAVWLSEQDWRQLRHYNNTLCHTSARDEWPTKRR
jgi:hypothetical protein